MIEEGHSAPTWQTGRMRRSRTPRVARGAIVASVATFTALLSHVVAGGAVPGPLGILAPWLLALMASTLLAGRSLSFARLGASVVLSQALFHTLFVMGAVAPTAAMPAMSHHDHGAMSLGMDAASPAPAAGFLSALCADPAMWALHAIAAIVTVALLYRGERAARALLTLAADIRAWARRIAARAAALPPTALPVPLLAETIGWIVRPAAHVGDGRRRGPPLTLAL